MRIYLNGQITETPLEDLTKDSLSKIWSITLEFPIDKKDEATDLVVKFPKYCKVNHGVRQPHQFDSESKPVYVVGFNIDTIHTNYSTGSTNETAQKRRDKVFEILNIK